MEVSLPEAKLKGLEMRLSSDDVNLFFKLHPAFLFYSNKRLGTIPGVDTLDRFMRLSFQKKGEIRNVARQHPELILDFIEDNPFSFKETELAIIHTWQYAVDGSFYLLRYESEYSIFLDTGTTPKAYGVVSLNNDFRNILGDKLPVYVKTVLLPFKNQIIYDGFIFTYPITFDDPVEQELEADLDIWQNRYGIITQLPFLGDNLAETEEDRLRYFLRSQRNREVYADEIRQILQEHDNLTKLYYELVGKLDARSARKFFQDLGIRDIWCAVLDGRILTTGKNRESVLETLSAVLPKERKLFPYIFHFKM